jgi:DNA uptake protein ComE-like DNA-binding protein
MAEIEMGAQEAASVIPEQRTASSRAKFDPNHASIEELRAQGIPAPIAHRISNYRLKGGVFCMATDLYKIYGIDSLLVQELLRWIVIEDYRKPRQTIDAKSDSSSSAKRKVQVEINTADSIAFAWLPGIGPVLSRRIINYRNVLGGFYTIKQLNEVYGISDSLLMTFADNLTVDTSKISRLALNSASLSDLRKHPYINAYEARAILSYRELIGPFTAYDQLIDNYILSEENYRKVRSYLSLN